MPYDDLGDAAIAAHDRQRQLPAEAHRAIFESLCAHLRGRGRCLDAGVGTGSIAVPLAAAGIPVVGVDVSRAMLDALRTKAGETSLPLTRGDLARLPFCSGAFGAALAANVFHLIPAWRVAVAELVRVVCPGGLLLVNLGSGGPSDGPGASVLARFQEFLGGEWTQGQSEVGPHDASEFEGALLWHGVTVLPAIEIRYQQTSTLEAVIARLEHNVFARPKSIDQPTMHEAAAATRAWARERFGALDEPLVSEHVISYRIFQLPPEIVSRA